MEELFDRYPALRACEDEIRATLAVLIECYEKGGKLLLCGNGGSCADSEHIVGELMKGFLKKRPLTAEQKQGMREHFKGIDDSTLDRLQNGLPALSLTSMIALNTAFCNDVSPELMFAQPLFVLAREHDVFLGISTSGNAKNVCAAAKVAKSLGMRVLGLTGKHGGELRQLADVCIAVPETETFKVQELHLPVYHALCVALESHFF